MTSLRGTNDQSQSSGECTPASIEFSQIIFSLQYGETVVSFPINTHVASILHPYKIHFLEELSRRAVGEDEHTVPLSRVTLALRFLRYLMDQCTSIDTTNTILRAFEEQFMACFDIHSMVAGTSDPLAARRQALGDYFSAVEYTSSTPKPAKSALFQSAHVGISKLLVVFGGQGPANASCVKELRTLSTTYRYLLRRLIVRVTPLLTSLCQHPDTKQFFAGRMINLQSWLTDNGELPDDAFLGSAPVSFPIIGLLDLAHYCVTCQILNKTPGEVAASFHGVSGHSQGIVVAAAVSKSSSWDSFYANACLAVEILFWIGFESHLHAPSSFISVDTLQDSVTSGEGQPSPMLSVRGFEQIALDDILRQCNTHLPLNSQVHIALANSRSNFVVAGPRASLCGLCKFLRDVVVSPDEDQTRIPFSQRKPVVSYQFLPISAPFHTPYLSQAASKIKERLHDKTFTACEANIPLLHTTTGEVITSGGHVSIIESLVDAITTGFADFPRVLSHPETSHFVVFGLGRLGELVKQNRQGYGQRIICGSETDVVSSDTGSKAELFSSILPSHELPWGKEYAPQLLRTRDGTLALHTKLSHLLRVPPVLVAGMTPTTAPWDFVAAVMNAGYYAELAGGGYYSDSAMENAIRTLASEISPGRGITVNLIYVNPEAIAWQTRLVRKLIHQGIPVDGITIGAGVPSLSVARGYIDDIGLKHISFKPGSVNAIMAVLEIADDRPEFPIILQWTGGRGGGHHSFEDFHAPILSTYHECRKRKNIFLIAGSGFGAGEDTYPYISGTWSRHFGYPEMPFDGVLLGSRLMVCREAHTSPQVKKLICDTPGVEDSGWERTYSGSAGGVITVRSEMGQPIHKIANRGVSLWAELDQTVFALSRPKMVEELNRRKEYIISRLNRDYAKPWFGRDATGDPIDLIDMTYTAVLRRMIQLMYVSHQKRWIHSSYMRLVHDFALRALSRASTHPGSSFNIDALEDPKGFLELFTSHFTKSNDRQLHPDDATFFVQRCKARGQKPVNFIPILDENFEYWFKKDSLWQSEDLEAVVDQDVERVCVLQGPVAVRHSVDQDESAHEILKNISDFHISTLLLEGYANDLTRIPKTEDPASTSPLSLGPPDYADESTVCTQSFCALPGDTTNWLDVFAANSFGWIHDLQVVLRDSKDVHTLAVLHRSDVDNIISLHLYQPSNFTAGPATLTIQYRHISTGLSTALEELTNEREARIKLFYSNLWLGYEMDTSSPDATFTGPPITLTHDLIHELCEALGFLHIHISEDNAIPLDVAIVVAWEALVKPLLIPAISGDLLRLVHRSNSIEYCPSAKPFQLGDILQSSSQIQSINIENTGKSLVVKASIERNGLPVATLTSSFFMQGIYSDFDACFENIVEPEIEITISTSVEEQVLRSRPWLSLDAPKLNLVGRTLSFYLTTSTSWRSKQAIERLKISGSVFLKAWNGEKEEFGRVFYQAVDCKGNPVLDFLHRKGVPVAERKMLKEPVQLFNTAQAVQIPLSNETYSQFSKDFNPIHISGLFAEYAELPGTITHGMYTSAAVRSLVEQSVADGDSRRFRRWSCSFVGMVLPGDQLDVQVVQLGLIEGRLLLTVTVVNSRTQDQVLHAEAEVEQAPTVYIFTGQGSQSIGMGMESYRSSPAARKVWDNANRFLLDKFDGSVVKEPIIKDLTSESKSYTFSDPRGLLFSTQFAQPIIVLLEQAAMADLKHRGVIQEGAGFAGHSLGEYGALSSFAEFMRFEDLLQVVFYRGLAMQLAIERDSQGHTKFSMVAVNPARVGNFFTEQVLKNLVEMITTTTGTLLEIVNFNVEGEQYVCAGTLDNLHALGATLDYIAKAPNGASISRQVEENAQSREGLGVVLRSIAESQQLASPITLQRGTATIPLQGIDVPFHSAHLRTGVPSYRSFLEERIQNGDVNPQRLIGKWIPNITGKPFSLSSEYIQDVHRLTGSPILAEVLAA
ncbi:fatty acid synthase subunit beta [Penicillium macrosclerotiorum]|uniref:fatty acid synthase subunit beta n=1 Tax=Penicillium macrosclerotiorum TaxID=303699 RepID=UPI00254843FC|nr:fatty acid synthase subunit beta [Penicillium macrosclerotiorum]KAJ5689024.1 fatty acid synthase subunit beta [Penicillium macrosclerotiorum]